MKRSANVSGVKVSGLRLKKNEDGTFTDQYGRLLQKYVDPKTHKTDLRPIGVDPRGARH